MYLACIVHVFFMYLSCTYVIPYNILLTQPDGKLVAMLMVNLFRLDATVPVKEGYEMDLLRNNTKPLAYFGKDHPGYSKLGVFILKEFWLKKGVVPSISDFISIKSESDIAKVYGMEISM